MLRLLLRSRTRLIAQLRPTTTPPVEPPEPPPESACCGQGCANCVWIKYGADLIDFYKKKGLENALRDIEKKIADPNIRAFVLSELKSNSQ